MSIDIYTSESKLEKKMVYQERSVVYKPLNGVKHQVVAASS